jgi:hypothetical protein
MYFLKSQNIKSNSQQKLILQMVFWDHNIYQINWAKIEIWQQTMRKVLYMNSYHLLKKEILG